ncbi:unnamed protein product [Brassicogethes aeneus]|uniref:Glutaredoxin domain-containing protein n=1 Tax=Brassicogethes aeneus TaxID=1431903 RepID=A0A9P0FLL5_BRAAE|nr:unnamed protein product [Brassicogethes aeneus]
MNEVDAVVPPLPPKTKKSPLLSQSDATVLSQEVPQSLDVYQYRIQEVPEANIVKIHINPISNNHSNRSTTLINQENDNDVDYSSIEDREIVRITTEKPRKPSNGVVCITVNNPDSDMVNMDTQNNPYFFYGSFNNCVMSSGQISPSDTLDSGTCSDLDGTPPPLPKKKSTSVTLIGGGHRSAPSSSSGAEIDSDDNESSISCDSLTSGKISPINQNNTSANDKSSFLPTTLLQDIRLRSSKLSPSESPIATPIAPVATPVTTPVTPPPVIVDEKTYEDRLIEETTITKNKKNLDFDTDMFYNFHMNEHLKVAEKSDKVKCVVEDETFAGYKDILGDGAATIRSAKGTVRGVKNRVRNGIATFLQIHSDLKNYKEKEAGKVVVYTTTMGILRNTYQACMKVKQILRTLLVKFEERDVFMSAEFQAEIQERMHCDHILVPQVFVDGQHIGDAETIERLNESGELRRILKNFKSTDACSTCKSCGGYRLMPCTVCNGSKKSVHRNHFTAEFVALKCMNCDEVGLVRCPSC